MSTDSHFSGSPTGSPTSHRFDVRTFVAAAGALGPSWIRVNSGLLSCRLPAPVALTVVFFKMLAELRFVEDVRRAAQGEFSALIDFQSRILADVLAGRRSLEYVDPDWLYTLKVFCHDRFALRDARPFVDGHFISSLDECILSTDGAILCVSPKIPLCAVVRTCRQHYAIAEKVAAVVAALTALHDGESREFARTTSAAQCKHLRHVAKKRRVREQRLFGTQFEDYREEIFGKKQKSSADDIR
jgi:hypothetical protein